MNSTFHGYRRIRSGDLSLLYGDGEIRQVRLGNTQVISSIYAAVRDQNWGTVPAKILKETIREEHKAFTIELQVVYMEAEVDFTASILIRGESSRLRFDFKGMARSSFLKNRIGLCILHPLECKGLPLTILHPDGSSSRGIFPEQISADQPFMKISGMQWKASDFVSAELLFKGDLFEMEDQRNWTDASYKTYCTPLELPFPVKVQMGEKVRQSLRLDLISRDNTSRIINKDILSLHLQKEKKFKLPAIGCGSSTEAEAMSPGEAEALKNIRFSHIRADLWLAESNLEEQYGRIAEEQRLLGWPLELCLHFKADYLKEVLAFLELYRQRPLRLKQVLLFDADHLSCSNLLEQVLHPLKESLSHIPMGGGTNAYYAELNRNHPDARNLDFISYSICPQVHAVDKLSLIENLEAQADTVASAQKLFERPVSIGAISLRQRFNIVATDEAGQSDYPLSDDRQNSVFAAGWTLGSIKQLAMAGASSATYFETVGPRGLMEANATVASPSRLYPLFHLFREILDGKSKYIFPPSTSSPLCVDGLLLEREEGYKILLVNYTEAALRVQIDLAGSRPEAIFILDSGAWTESELPDLENMVLSASSIYKIVLES